MSWEWSFFLNCVFHWLEINAVGFSYIIADWTWVKMLPILNRFHQIEMCQELFSLLFVLFSLSLSLHIYISHQRSRPYFSLFFSIHISKWKSSDTRTIHIISVCPCNIGIYLDIDRQSVLKMTLKLIELQMSFPMHSKNILRWMSARTSNAISSIHTILFG